MKIVSLLFISFLYNVAGFFQYNPRIVNKLKYRNDDDEWSHGEVQWDFPDKYMFHDKLIYTSLIQDTFISNNITIQIKENYDINKKEEFNNAIYFGIMKTINKEAVNFQEILLNIQNICFVKSDSNEDVSKDFYILLLIYTLKTNYELSKSRENELLTKLSDKKKYLKVKRIVSCIMLMIFTILCRNVNSAV